MSTWTPEQIETIAREEDFHLSADRPEGEPKWVRIWGVTVGDRAYVRSFNGTAGKWYNSALDSGSGHIAVGDIDATAVRFVPVDEADEDVNQAVDAAYRAQYEGSPYAVTMSTEPVRRNTLVVVPA